MSHESHREWQLLTEGNPNGTHVSRREPRWQSKTWHNAKGTVGVEKRRGVKGREHLELGSNRADFQRYRLLLPRSLQERTQRGTKCVLAFIFPQLPTKTSQRVHKSILNHIWEN